MNRYNEKDLLSAFQKGFRQCDDYTLFYAKELDLMDTEIVWQKLEVIGSEDIGIACPTSQTFITKQHEKYNGLTDIWEKRLVLLNTVNYLVKQNKSRICDNANHAYFKEEQPFMENTQFVTLINGFKKGIYDRNFDMSVKYASHLFKLGKEYELIDILREPSDENSIVLINLFNKYNSVQRNRTDVLFLVHLILYRVMDLNKISTVEVEDLLLPKVKAVYLDDSVLFFGDYVFDKHTDLGKSLGRGFKHFYEVGAKLEQCQIDDPYEEIAKRNNTKMETTVNY